MKRKILILILCFLLLNAATTFANTYDYILKDNGYTDIHNNYISKSELKTMLSLIFKEDISYEPEVAGHATGLDFFSITEELGHESFMVANKEAYYNRALTFLSFYELLDYYFPVITDKYDIESYNGKLSKSHSGYVVTYGNGITGEFTEFNFFKVKEDYCDVQVIVKGEEIIDICPSQREVPFSLLCGKKEVFGKLFLLYEDGIIIDCNGELVEYPVTKDFKFLNKKGENVALIIGNYKKNKDLAAIAVGRND